MCLPHLCELGAEPHSHCPTCYWPTSLGAGQCWRCRSEAKRGAVMSESDSLKYEAKEASAA